ncbi:DUF6531 domain-containing protein [Xanthomonas arboricola]|uniref:DUF6531 domain-containing protein n=1 Tax=Xanthomonas arboricola TaxID=56448 RepID=UPI00141B2D7E|nr:DUF6531 domain-containing protein [Xanthomonas arboricola]NIK53934.1 YD repeat-containing protein [Xanthomonas arboricola]
MAWMQENFWTLTALRKLKISLSLITLALLCSNSKDANAQEWACTNEICDKATAYATAADWGRYYVREWSSYAPGAYYMLTDGCDLNFCIVNSSLNLSDNITQATRNFAYYKSTNCEGLACEEALDAGKNNSCDNQCILTGPTLTGNPIHVFTGAKIQAVKDYASTTGHLDFARYYTSSESAYSPGGELGRHWRHGYQSRLTTYWLDDQKVIILSRPSGNHYRFKKPGTEWITDADVQDRLTATSENGKTGWRVKNSRNEQEYYDNSGILIRIEYPDGDVVSLHYDGNLQLVEVRDRQGRALLFTYTGKLLNGLSTPDGTKLHYTYEGTRLIKTEHANDSAAAGSLQYKYESTSGSDLLTGIIDESGQRYASWSYDANGLATSSRHGGVDSDIDKITILRSKGQASVTNALGQTSHYDYVVSLGRANLSASDTNCDTCLSGAYFSRVYDANSYPQSTVDFAGNSTSTQYDTRGLLVSRTDANNRVGKRTFQTDWHPDFAVPLERRVYDAANALAEKSRWTYNTRGQALTVSQVDPSTDTARTTTNAYCEQADIDAGACSFTWHPDLC